MYNDKDYGINWIGLFLKVIVIVIFILLAVWLVTKVFFSYSNKDLKNDLSRMKATAENYFTQENLPKDVGKSKILTLNEMLTQNLLKSKTIDACDKEQSYAKATKYDQYSLIKVELVCGNKKDSTTIKVDNDGNKSVIKKDDTTKDTAKDDSKTKEEKNNTNKSEKNTKNNSNSNNNTGSTQNNSNSSTKSSNSETTVIEKKNTSYTKKTLYYEQAKIKYERTTRKMANYCKQTTNTYYTLANTSYDYYVRGNKFTYTVYVTDIPANATNVKVGNIRKFTQLDEYYKYVDERNQNKIMWTGGKNNGGLTYSDAIYYKNHSATSGYNAQIDYNESTKIITITVNKTNTITSLPKDGNIYMPIKFDITYDTTNNSDCTQDTYDNRNLYPGYKITGTWYSTANEEAGLDYTNTKWTTSQNLEGYKPTGKTEYR